MISMFIDTTSPHITVALIKNDELVSIYKNEIKSDVASKIFPIIDNLFSNQEFTIKDINKIYVVNGPGSFTGIRIGVTIAKVLASQMNIDIYPISSLELMASGSSKNCLALIDARRGFVYAGAYDGSLNLLESDKYVALNELDLNCYDEVVSYDNIENTHFPEIDIIKIVKKYKDKTMNPHTVNPNYLKLTEAEENKR